MSTLTGPSVSQSPPSHAIYKRLPTSTQSTTFSTNTKNPSPISKRRLLHGTCTGLLPKGLLEEISGQLSLDLYEQLLQNLYYLKAIEPLKYRTPSTNPHSPEDIVGNLVTQEVAELQEFIFCSMTELSLSAIPPASIAFDLLINNRCPNITHIELCSETDEVSFRTLIHNGSLYNNGSFSICNYGWKKSDELNGGANYHFTLLLLSMSRLVHLTHLKISKDFVKNSFWSDIYPKLTKVHKELIVLSNLKVLDLSAITSSSNSHQEPFFIFISSILLPQVHTILMNSTTLASKDLTSVLYRWVKLLTQLKSIQCDDKPWPLTLDSFDILKSPLLSYFTTVNLSPQGRSVGCNSNLERLLALSHEKSNLVNLSLGSIHINPKTIKKLSASSWLTNVTTLNLSGTNLTDFHIKSLIESPYLNNIKSLDISNNHGITDYGMKLIFSKQSFVRHLTCLNINGCSNITWDTFTELYEQSDNYTNLTRLILGHYPNTRYYFNSEKFIELLSQAVVAIPSLKELIISSVNFTPSSFMSFVDSPMVRQLDHLELISILIQDEQPFDGVKRRSRGHSSRLIQVGVPFGNQAFGNQPFGNQPFGNHHLNSDDINDNIVGFKEDSDFNSDSNHSNMSNDSHGSSNNNKGNNSSTSSNNNNNNINNNNNNNNTKGNNSSTTSLNSPSPIPPFQYLLQSPNIVNLRTLSLEGSQFADNEMIHLANNPALSNLRYLNISGSGYLLHLHPIMQLFPPFNRSYNHGLTDNGIQNLVLSPYLYNLECLVISKQPALTEKSFQYIANAPFFFAYNLHTLIVDIIKMASNKIGKILKRSPYRNERLVVMTEKEYQEEGDEVWFHPEGKNTVHFQPFFPSKGS